MSVAFAPEVLNELNKRVLAPVVGGGKVDLFHLPYLRDPDSEHIGVLDSKITELIPGAGTTTTAVGSSRVTAINEYGVMVGEPFQERVAVRLLGAVDEIVGLYIKAGLTPPPVRTAKNAIMRALKSVFRFGRLIS